MHPVGEYDPTPPKTTPKPFPEHSSSRDGSSPMLDEQQAEGGADISLIAQPRGRSAALKPAAPAPTAAAPAEAAIMPATDAASSLETSLQTCTAHYDRILQMLVKEPSNEHLIELRDQLTNAINKLQDTKALVTHQAGCDTKALEPAAAQPSLVGSDPALGEPPGGHHIKLLEPAAAEPSHAGGGNDPTLGTPQGGHDTVPLEPAATQPSHAGGGSDPTLGTPQGGHDASPLEPAATQPSHAGGVSSGDCPALGTPQGGHNALPLEPAATQPSHAGGVSSGDPALGTPHLRSPR
jgi:hypothetical protein